MRLTRPGGVTLLPLLLTHVLAATPLAAHRSAIVARSALHDAVATHGRMAADAAAAYVKEMQEQGRLVQELWS